MSKKAPAFTATEIPSAMACDKDGRCSHCRGGGRVTQVYYPGRDPIDLCRPCMKLFGLGTRWKYVGGGSIQGISRMSRFLKGVTV